MGGQSFAARLRETGAARSLVVVLAVVLAVVAGGCNSTGDEPRDAGGGEGGSEAGRDGGGEAGSNSAGTGGRPPGNPALCVDGGEIPTELPSTQTVTLTVRNDSDADRYLPVEGNGPGPTGCSPYEVGASGREEPSRGCSTCGGSATSHCDGALAFATKVVSLEPGASWDLSWDARELMLCASPRSDCPWYSTEKGALQPAPSGVYDARVVAYGALPAWCTEPPASSVYECDTTGLGGATVWRPYGLCDAPRDVELFGASVEFTLPESGVVEVVLPLN